MPQNRSRPVTAVTLRLAAGVAILCGALVGGAMAVGQALPDGGVIAFTQWDNLGNSDIHLIDICKNRLINLTKSPGLDMLPSWSPNGQQLAFVSDRAGNWDIYLMDFGGGNLRQLTQDAAQDSLPLWSSDGQYLAFISAQNGSQDVYIMNMRGSNRQRLTVNQSSSNEQMSWLINGRQIVFRMYEVPPQGIGIMDAQTGIGTFLALGQDFGSWPMRSPDGLEVAYLSTVSGDNEIFVSNTDGNNLKRLTFTSSSESSINWSSDSERLAFVSYENGFGEIYIIRADGSELQRLTSNDYDDLSPVWRP